MDRSRNTHARRTPPKAGSLLSALCWPACTWRAEKVLQGQQQNKHVEISLHLILQVFVDPELAYSAI